VKRIVEIDFFRGIAILLMMIFHTVFNLNYFLGINIEYAKGFWYYEGKLSAIMFMVLAGISSNFSKRTTKRGLKIFALGMLLTAITFLLDREMYKVRHTSFHGYKLFAFAFIKKNRYGNIFFARYNYYNNRRYFL
jgi:peptidoglycan/LPS O-acetylase OafA/YrhL